MPNAARLRVLCDGKSGKVAAVTIPSRNIFSRMGKLQTGYYVGTVPLGQA